MFLHSWNEHAAAITTKAKKASYLIARLVPRRTDNQPSFTNTYPTIRAIRTLVMAVIIPIITYGFPFWKPNAKSMNSFLSIISTPLKRVLLLPSTVDRFSLLTECGIPDPNTIWERSVLQFHRRCKRLSPSHPSYSLVDSCHRSKGFHHWFTSTHKKWELELKQTKTIKLAGALRQSNVWRTRGKCRDLISLRPITSTGMASYLRTDPPIVTCIRARLRFNRSYLNHSMYRRHAIDSPACSCGADGEETISHVLYSCPLYRNARIQLDSHPILTFDEPLLLGEVSHLRPASIRRTALSYSAKFLLDVAKRRKGL
jgi:hypothetical protein